MPDAHEVIWPPKPSPQNCPFCNRSITPREVGDRELQCPNCERRWKPEE